MSTRIQRTTCITCHGEDLRPYREAEGDGEPFHLVRCPACGTVFVSDPLAPAPPATAETLPTPDRTVVDADTTRPGHAYLHAGVIAHIDRIAPTPSAPVRMLEVGAGRGDLALMLLRRYGERIAYTGIEPFGEYAAVALARGLSVQVSDLQAFSARPQGPFDLILLDNVLEHLIDPASALSALRAMLAPGGALVVVVPNLRDVRRFYPSLYRRRYLWIPQEHVNYFTWRSLRAIMAANGLQARFPHPPLSGSWRRRLAWGAKALAERLLGLSPRGLYAVATRTP
jgi:SAM-dependent methyltransferase